MSDHHAPHAGACAADLAPDLARMAGHRNVYHGRVDAGGWLRAAQRARECDGRLVALWGTDRRNIDAGQVVCAVYLAGADLAWLELPVDGGARPQFPDLSEIFPCADRMQRACADLSGIFPSAPADARPWLRHAGWPADYHPLRRQPSGRESFGAQDELYAFVPVQGEGVHEIGVGPVHAGIIEPGHFRFSVVGEKVLRLEQRLGFVHKGIEKRFEGMDPVEAAPLAGRVSGGRTVAYAWAYCGALEAAGACAVPARARWLRALALERERVGNHLGDLGAIINDCGFAFGWSQFSRLREDWVRGNAVLAGHRLMMDWIAPGGLAADTSRLALDLVRSQCDALEPELRTLQDICDTHEGLQDRLTGTGCVTTDLARRLDLTGLAARGSGLATDTRLTHPVAPYEQLQVRAALEPAGDVGARVAVRFAEIRESLRLLRILATELPDGPVRTALAPMDPGALGLGWAEGWRGMVLAAVQVDARGQVLRAHLHDPSWQNWPALEHAVIGNIVPDFPLINKSFNLSYSGQDL